jgi:hypothetical protein
MKSRVVFGTMLMLVTVFSLIGWTGYGQKHAGSNNIWEYKVIVPDVSESGNWLEQAGQQGWELVSVSTDVQSGSTTNKFYYFKRAK